MTQSTHKLFVRAAVAAVLVVAGRPAKAQIHSGSLTPPVSANELSQRIAASRAEFASVLAKALSPDSVQAMLRMIEDQQNLAGGGVTNFDNVNAPCLFGGTIPLLGLEQFALFFAPLQSGGAILNECSNFGVNALTPPNFLAFNNTSTYMMGGIARTPELIVVGQNKSRVSLWISGGSTPGFPLAVVALGNDAVLEIVTTATSPDWMQIVLNATGIQAIALVGNPIALVVDDIEAQ
jgi:hypothetical protein